MVNNILYKKSINRGLGNDENSNEKGIKAIQLGLIISLLFLLLFFSMPSYAKSFNNIMSSKAPEGTPVAVVQEAIEALYYGDTAKAASYYHITDIPNFEAELKAIQPVFAQTVQSVSMSEIFYDKTGNKAAVVGTIQLIDPSTNQTQSDSVLYKLVKVKGDWKIVN